MKKLLPLLLVAATVGLFACSKGTSVPAGSEATAAAQAPQVAATNPTNFPLYSGAVVIAAKPFTQTVNASAHGMGAMSSGAGTYSGNEVIAGSSASLADLENWLRQIEKQPPSGYTAVVVPANMTMVHSIAMKNGVDYDLFREASNPKHGVMVIAMDPATTDKKLGKVIALVSKYESLPGPLKNGIDNQLKQRFGYSASDFVNPGSPLGSAVGALDDFKNRDQRAVLLIDVSKQ